MSNEQTQTDEEHWVMSVLDQLEKAVKEKDDVHALLGFAARDLYMDAMRWVATKYGEIVDEDKGVAVFDKGSEGEQIMITKTMAFGILHSYFTLKLDQESMSADSPFFRELLFARSRDYVEKVCPQVMRGKDNG